VGAGHIHHIGSIKAMLLGLSMIVNVDNHLTSLKALLK